MRLEEVKIYYHHLNELRNCRLPSRLSYAIAKNLKTLEAEIELIEAERVKLAENYAEKDEEGKAIVNDGKFQIGENAEALQKDFLLFLSTDTEINVHKCSCDILETLDELRYDILTPAQMEALDFMIE